jgi:hypothetical protein
MLYAECECDRLRQCCSYALRRLPAVTYLEDVTRATKIEAAFMLVVWAALAAALAGALTTPRNHCAELAAPAGQLAVIVGLAVAGVAALVPIGIESFSESSWRRMLIWLAITLLAVVEANRVASWGCG